MAKKNKGKRLIATLYHKETGHFYTTERNVMNTPEKLVLKKYNPVLRKVVEYVEGKTA